MTRHRSFPARLRTSVLPLGAAGALALAGSCKAFDPELYQNAAAGGGGSGGASNWTTVEDHCPFPDSEIVSSDTRTHTGTVALNELADDVQTCGKLTGFDGPDGVIGFALAAGERVHLEAEFVNPPGQTSPPVDLGIYVMNTCDSTACATRVERCPPGGGEHLLWNAQTSGTFFFGFDSKAYDVLALAPELRVTITYPRCGDGQLDKGETCDDGNVASGDGCTNECLAELTDTGIPPVEVEPNNYYIGANLVVVGAGQTARIKGQIGGGCDLDFFFLDVPEGGFPRVTMLGTDGQECPAGTPAFPLEFDDPSGVAELGEAKIPADSGGTNYCPEFDETTFPISALPQGRYVVELKPFDKGAGQAPFKYLLEVEMVGPPAGTGGTGSGGTGGSDGG